MEYIRTWCCDVPHSFPSSVARNQSCAPLIDERAHLAHLVKRMDKIDRLFLHQPTLPRSLSHLPNLPMLLLYKHVKTFRYIRGLTVALLPPLPPLYLTLMCNHHLSGTVACQCLLHETRRYYLFFIVRTEAGHGYRFRMLLPWVLSFLFVNRCRRSRWDLWVISSGFYTQHHPYYYTSCIIPIHNNIRDKFASTFHIERAHAQP